MFNIYICGAQNLDFYTTLHASAEGFALLCYITTLQISPLSTNSSAQSGYNGRSCGKLYKFNIISRCRYFGRIDKDRAVNCLLVTSCTIRTHVKTSLHRCYIIILSNYACANRVPGVPLPPRTPGCEANEQNVTPVTRPLLTVDHYQL